MTLPHSPEAEQSLVARLLLEPEQIAGVAADLPASDFYIAAYRDGYATMVSLVAQGKSVDVVSLGEAGEPVDVLSLTAGHHAPVATYVEIIKRKAYQRAMIEAGGVIIDVAHEGDVDQIIEATALAAERAISIPHDDRLGLVDLADFKHAPPPPLLGVISPDGTTVLYGDGGDGKGWVAAKWASQLDTRVAILDFENHPNEWAYRLDRFGLADALYMSPPSTLEKWADERARRLMQNEKIGFLIIDSAMYASNVDDPYSPASAMAYKRARSRLGNLPAILLAHTTGGQDKVFGSVFWRNEARIVWRLGQSYPTRQRYLECRKANNYRELEGKKFQIEFNEEAGILQLHDHGKPWTAGSPVVGIDESPVIEVLEW